MSKPRARPSRVVRLLGWTPPRNADADLQIIIALQRGGLLLHALGSVSRERMPRGGCAEPRGAEIGRVGSVGFGRDPCWGEGPVAWRVGFPVSEVPRGCSGRVARP